MFTGDKPDWLIEGIRPGDTADAIEEWPSAVYKYRIVDNGDSEMTASAFLFDFVYKFLFIVILGTFYLLHFQQWTVIIPMVHSSVVLFPVKTSVFMQ